MPGGKRSHLPPALGGYVAWQRTTYSARLMPQPEQPVAHIQIKMPDDLEAGAYANALAVWHTPHEFTLDFAAIQPTQEMRQADGTVVLTVPARVTARVKVPPTLLFEIIKAINENMTQYEQRFGSIRTPGPDEPLFPPDTYPEGEDEPGGTDG